MRFRIHQPSYIGDALIGPAEIDDNPALGKHHRGHDIEVKPLALKGDRLTHKVVGKKPEIVTLKDDLWPVPGPHWEPLDDAAKALCEKHGVQFIGEMPDVLSGLEEEFADAQARMQKQNAEMIAQAVAIGVREALREERASRK